MIRVWATVASWHQGVALLNCEPISGCGDCSVKQGCGISLLNQIIPQQHQWHIAIEQPLEPGQKVEIALAESSLLCCALLVYLPPLLGLLIVATIGQWLSGSEGGSVLGAIIGFGLGYGLARYQAHKLTQQQSYQPVVLQVGLSPSMIQAATNI